MILEWSAVEKVSALGSLYATHHYHIREHILQSQYVM
jgi:hypothetical protein